MSKITKWKRSFQDEFKARSGDELYVEEGLELIQEAASGEFYVIASVEYCAQFVALGRSRGFKLGLATAVLIAVVAMFIWDTVGGK